MADDPVEQSGALAQGDFHVIRMDGMFHVVFRPDSDPEWFRIIASFFTYDRAWSYCDIERVSAWDPDATCTNDEEAKGLRSPPTGEMPNEQGHREIVDLVRHVYEGERVQPRPVEDFSDHPTEDEHPKQYHDRVYAEAIARLADAGPAPAAEVRTDQQGEGEDEVSSQQTAVLDVLQRNANPEGLVSLSLAKIASQAAVPHGSISFLLDSLERKRLMRVVERGRAGQTTIYRVERVAA